ncbi:MAG TPA: hypothetical protein VML75_20545 [Kofleriaceae bacterium]|nr:hypothetical protein [Kofleriaceae bacterium]
MAVVCCLAFARPAQAQADDKSPWIATGLAVGVTVGGVAVGAVAESLDDDASSPATRVAQGVAYAGLVAGPSAGHWYAGEHGHALRWTGVRAAGLTALVGGIVLVDRYDDGAPFTSGLALMFVGGGAYAVGLYWDLFDAHRAARRSNRRAASRVAVAPMVGPTVGLQLAGMF